MCSAVLLLAVVAAIDPVRIGIAALLISRPRPMRNLFVFWLGGITTGIAVAVVVLLILRGFTLSVMRVVVSVLSRPIVAHAQVAIGVLALQIAALIGAHYWARRRTPVPVTGGGRSALILEPNPPSGSSRLSIGGRLERGSLVVAFAAGMAMATPPVEYLGAIVAILASGAGAGAQVGAALGFTLVAFAVAELPLVSYLATPAKTQAVLLRLHDWIRARRQAVLAIMVGVCGVLMVVAGVG
ncbi:GAP family protein [Mycobacterium sp. 852002-51057_SCH5723018]|uniref:GAP family protein n=1 Tax=Mycobacterium sp. 852002-51057_SCH5723018 TaxID=1834094 RepID=UPI0007FB8537|nr:GAP family protein [Mycobacterium sp. 852002-51057_SCH5723018]OBG28525.1 hypothetical protein A5764_25030 [Mycobacterium sp. 852002-51057_SCH5723018]